MNEPRSGPRTLRVACAFALAAFAACTDATRHEVPAVSLSSGTYRAVYGAGYAPGDEARVLAITATLDRAALRLVFTLADASRVELALAPRAPERWQPDCYTMTSHVLEEVADLSPAPLQLESMTFATPLVFAKCGPGRMILADTTDEASATTWLAFDLQ
ncbi:MAG TPA: hypothetical protein VF841_11465 [Anaeromyxobacter sp.]